ncbi:MAG: carboxypeptidase-like regulatory domain-containing protein [Cyclobacteriaceae bacterium]
MKKIIIILWLIAISQSSFSQQIIKGMVADMNHEPLIGATVLELNTQNGAVTDVNGKFQLALENENPTITISYTGYLSDTLKAVFSKPMHIMLKEDAQALNEVVVSSSSTFMDNLEPKHVEIITSAELTKAACCNLSESFETNASVDVSYTDAVSGAKTIQMLGLDGKYVQINRENIPLIRGLSQRYGLGYVPGTWLQSIDVGKGAGSVVNGYESMTGQLNVEFIKPENGEKLYLNGYVNSFGRTELNANSSFDLTDKWSSAILFHTDYFGNEIDKNEDGFMDIPKGKQINFLNRYKYSGERIMSQIGMQVMSDQKAGGQLGYGFEDDFRTSPEYGFANQTTRLELFGKTGVLFPEKPYQGIGLIYSGSYTDIDAGFGRKAYSGTEKTIYTNLIFQNIIGSTFHQYKAGLSFLYDDFDEVYLDSGFQRTEVVPGLFYEYSYLPSDKWSIVAGLRADFHNLYGTFFTPRLHMKHKIGEATFARFAVGKGRRVANPVMENTNILVSNRTFIVEEALNPEESWNIGGSIVSELNVGGKKINITGDYFYTGFQNQIIYDMDQKTSALVVYNLDGESYAHSLQLEAKVQLTEYFGIKGAYKYYDVKATINNELMRMPFISQDRFFLNASYASKYDKWEADATLQWYGEKRLPNTLNNPIEHQRTALTNDFILMNAQVSRGFRWGNIYLGSENLLNFRQSDPIIDAENPFGNNFDASFTWAPVAGRAIYAGFRYKIEN